ncbi:hypothetical protein VNI00_005989 [Paramarasmius palmivorus]|uniref:GmrSD restriction endonucleases N-terminal domain-containing protein n=1 Tax=Paramarasmius palmivorus TaxID=297713 RepID=A0AAW0DFZ2_9AGAR
MDSESEFSSQLTDEDELDQEYTTQARSSGKKKKGPGRPKAMVQQDNSYTIQNALKPPRATTYTAQALFEQIYMGYIDLDPEYQRDVVWSKEKQTQLIDSILRNYYIPPIIFAVTTHEDGSETRVCIDGKQRLTSIRLFMDGLIPHKDTHTGQLYWYKDNPGKTGRKTLLPDKYKTIFANKQVVCVEYGELRESDERDIFRRVQLGMALTPAEKLQSIATPRANFIRELLEKYNTEDTLGTSKISWDRERARDFHVFASVVHTLEKWITSGKPKTLALAGMAQIEKWLGEKTDDGAPRKTSGRKQKKKVNPDHDEEYFEDDDEDDEMDGEYGEVPPSFKKKVEEAFAFASKAVNTTKYIQKFVTADLPSKVAPMEMIGILMTAYVTQAKLQGDLKRFSELIMHMRSHLRSSHKDIRMNSRVGRCVLDFAFAAGRDPFKYSGPLGASATSASPNKKSKGKSKGKRAVADSEDNEDEGADGESDYEESRKQPKKKKSRASGASSVSRAFQAAKRTPSAREPLTPSTPTNDTTTGTTNPQRLPSPHEMSNSASGIGVTVKDEPGTPAFPTQNLDMNMLGAMAQMMAAGYNPISATPGYMPNMAGGMQTQMPAQVPPQMLAQWMQAMGSGVYPPGSSGGGGGGPTLRVGILFVFGSIAICIQGALIAVDDRWFTEREALCSSNLPGCPAETLNRSTTQLKEIAALALLLLVSLMVSMTIKWPTQSKASFTLLVLLSHPVFYFAQILSTNDVSSQLVDPPSSLTLRLRLEIVELTISLLSVPFFVTYIFMSWNKWELGTIWLYPFPFTVGFFAIEISLQPRPFFYVSTAFATTALVLGIVLGTKQWYHNRHMAGTPRNQNTMMFSAPRPPFQTHPLAPALRVPQPSSEPEDSLEIMEVPRTPVTGPSYIGRLSNSAVPLHPQIAASHKDSIAPNQFDNHIVLEPSDSATTLSILGQTGGPSSPISFSSGVNEATTPSTAPPSFHSRDPGVVDSAIAGPSGLTRNETFGSAFTYTTLPSYCSRRNSYALPPPALPVRGLPPLPPLPATTVQNRAIESHEV